VSLAADLKQWRTAQDECILAGLQAVLTEGDDGRPMIVVSKWALTRAFDDVAELQAWLARVTGRPVQQ